MDKIPLNYEASEGDTHKRQTSTLPTEVVQCLENARFLHLATCTDNVPNVSLMNYTYLPSSPYSDSPVIIMTTNPASRKTTNIIANSNVSLLVHDWVSHRPPTQGRRMSGGGSPAPETRSSLAALLLNLNTSAVSSISATIGGAARIAPIGSEEEKFYVAQHLENNTFEEGTPLFQPVSNTGNRENDGHFVAGEEVRVIVVDIRNVRISDFKGTVRDWELTTDAPLLNGGA
ncbi:hypothetical protein GGI43DRAFT_400792 [Trichoderma evansii]